METEFDCTTFNWDGWELDKNNFGEEFNLEARKRMHLGAKILKNFIGPLDSSRHLLEFGPFFNPIVSKRSISQNQRLVYIENDAHAIKWLNREQSGEHIATVSFDASELESSCFLRHLPAQLIDIKTFDTVVISQFINYVDYVTFFESVKRYLSYGAKLYINNVVDYGIPELFHERRPKSVSETIIVLLQLGFKLVKQELYAPPRLGDDSRLVLCCEYSGD